MRKFILLFFAIALAASSMAQNAFLNDTTSSIVKVGSTYMLGTTPLTTKQVGMLYQAQCPEAYKRYRSAHACTIAGATVFALGGLEIAGISIGRKALNSRTRSAAYSIGSAVCGTGLIVMLCAPLKYSKAVDIYNARHNYQLTLSPSVSADGVGLALQW